MVRRVLLRLIDCYQATLSPDCGPLRHHHPYGFCRHHPTCSMYGKQVISERGAIVGILLIMKRLLSCHPWKPVTPEKIIATMHR